MNSCWSEVLIHTKQCLELGTFLNLFSGMSSAMPLWIPSFPGAFSAHIRLDPVTPSGNGDVAGPGRIFSQTLVIWEQYGKEWPRPVASGTSPRPLATLFSLHLALDLSRVLGNALYLLVFRPVHLMEPL